MQKKKEAKKEAVTNIKDMPYERFERVGAGSLSDAELLAIIIRTGNRDENSVVLARKILEMPETGEKGILGLHHLSLQDLMTVKGIGIVKAVKIKCITELSNRIAEATAGKKISFDRPSTVADYYMERLRHLETEMVLLLMTDNRNHLIGESVISRGTVNSSVLSPREIFIQAVKEKAVYVMLLHNHPSGDATPSKQDISITRQVAEAGTLLNIPLIDHIVIGDNQFTSFRETGLL